MEKIIEFSNLVKVLSHNNKIILGNRENGKWLKMSKSCFDVLKIAIKENATGEELINALEDEDDKSYFKELLECLFNADILVSNKCKMDKKLSIDVAITNRCNLRCKHCCVDSDYANVIDPLSTNELKILLKKVVDCKPNNICLTGGEPLMREDFLDILQYLRSIYQGEIRIMTNGTLITNMNVHELVNNVSAIDISLDGIDEETCSIIRGTGVFEKVIKAVKLLQFNNFFNISLSMVMTKENYSYRKEFEKLNKDLKTRGLIRAFSPIGRGEINSEYLQPKEKEVQIEEQRMSKMTQDDLHICMCGAIYRELYINYKGDIYPCGLLEKDKYFIGNIFELTDLNSYVKEEKCKGIIGYQYWEQLQPDKYERCQECDVNLFCWTCLHYLDLIDGNNAFFENVCPTIQKYLQNLVWED